LKFSANPIGTAEYLAENIVHQSGPLETDCWIWQKAIDKAGYGRYGASDKQVRYVHRLSYELVYGEIEEGMYVCHKCDTRSCCNPDHLFMGTAQDNNDDMYSKNRAYHPKAHPNFRSIALNKSQVLEIKQMLLDDELSMVKIAQIYGVSISTIHRIKFNKTWKDVNL